MREGWLGSGSGSSLLFFRRWSGVSARGRAGSLNGGVTGVRLAGCESAANGRRRETVEIIRTAIRVGRGESGDAGR